MTKSSRARSERKRAIRQLSIATEYHIGTPPVKATWDGKESCTLPPSGISPPMDNPVTIPAGEAFVQHTTIKGGN